MNIKKIVSIGSLVFVTSIVFGQGDKKPESIDMNTKEYALPIRKYPFKGNKPYARTRKQLKDESAKVVVSLNYHRTNFLNGHFAMNKEAGDLSHNFGTSLNYRIISGYPFLFDINWFSSRFEYTGDDENNPLYEAYKIRHRGLELAVNFVLLPSNRHFITYVGIGYQSASLIASNLWPMEEYADDENKNNNDTESIKYKSNCSGLIWKTGVMLEYRRATFSIEYKQSLKAKSEKASNQLSIGVGLLY